MDNSGRIQCGRDHSDGWFKLMSTCSTVVLFRVSRFKSIPLQALNKWSPSVSLKLNTTQISGSRFFTDTDNLRYGMF